MAAVICKKEISAKLGGYYSTFGGNPVSCAMGIAVLVGL
jgi:4-aminobutyrate aminotransferase-like enzyme